MLFSLLLLVLVILIVLFTDLMIPHIKQSHISLISFRGTFLSDLWNVAIGNMGT